MSLKVNLVDKVSSVEIEKLEKKFFLIEVENFFYFKNK